MIYNKIRQQDILETKQNLIHLKVWLQLNMETITLAEFKKLRKEIEQLESQIQILKDIHG